MPYWALIIAIVVLVVGYYLLTQQGRERRRDRVVGDFARIPDFRANQTYIDVAGDTALGFDDRQRRVAVARKHGDPRVRVYSFAHIQSAEVLQDATVIQIVASATAGGVAAAPAPETEGAVTGSLFGATRQGAGPGITGLPAFQPVAGQLSRVAVRVTFRDGGEGDQVPVTFYAGKPVNVDSVAAERAFAESQVLMGAVAVAVKRAAVPHRAGAAPKTPVL